MNQLLIVFFAVAGMIFAGFGLHYVVIKGELFGLVLMGIGAVHFWLGILFYRYDKLQNCNSVKERND